MVMFVQIIALMGEYCLRPCVIEHILWLQLYWRSCMVKQTAIQYGYSREERGMS